MTIKDEKDRLGDKLRDVERGREDDYFARRDRELLEKMRSGQGSEAEASLRQGAIGRCPKCGIGLRHRELRGVNVDECETCGGLWLEKGELEVIAKGENDGWIARWLRTELGG